MPIDHRKAPPLLPFEYLIAPELMIHSGKDSAQLFGIDQAEDISNPVGTGLVGTHEPIEPPRNTQLRL
jgi:hypothetical protein